MLTSIHEDCHRLGENLQLRRLTQSRICGAPEDILGVDQEPIGEGHSGAQDTRMLWLRDPRPDTEAPMNGVQRWFADFFLRSEETPCVETTRSVTIRPLPLIEFAFENR